MIRLEKTNVTKEEDQDRVYRSILHVIEARMNKRILIEMFEETIIDDEATQGYYIVKWVSEPYTVQENTIMKGAETLQTDFFWRINL